MCKYYPPECDSGAPEGQLDRRRMKSPDDCPFLIEAANLAVKRTFAILGIDVDDPEKVEQFRQDLRYARESRTDSANRKSSIENAGILVIVGAVLAVLWLGIAHSVREHTDIVTANPPVHGEK